MGLCLSGVLPDGVWSEWGFAQWGFALDSCVRVGYGILIKMKFMKNLYFFLYIVRKVRELEVLSFCILSLQFLQNQFSLQQLKFFFFNFCFFFFLNFI